MYLFSLSLAAFSSLWDPVFQALSVFTHKLSSFMGTRCDPLGKAPMLHPPPPSLSHEERSSHGLLMALWYSTCISPFLLPLSPLSDRHMFQQPLVEHIHVDKANVSASLQPWQPAQVWYKLGFTIQFWSLVNLKSSESVVQVRTSKPATETLLSNSKQV